MYILIEFSKLKHHDQTKMTCQRGKIDYQCQLQYKEKLQKEKSLEPDHSEAEARIKGGFDHFREVFGTKSKWRF